MKIHHEGTKRSLQKLEISSTNSAANFHQPISHSNSLSHLESERERAREENLTQSMLQLDMGPIH